VRSDATAHVVKVVCLSVRDVVARCIPCCVLDSSVGCSTDASAGSRMAEPVQVLSCARYLRRASQHWRMWLRAAASAAVQRCTSSLTA